MAESVLGFKIDSSQAAHAAVDLDKMTAAAGKAEQAAIKVGTSASKASRDFGDLGPALQKIIGGIDKLNQTSSSIETKLETMGRAAGIAAQKTKTVGDAATASSAELNKLRAEVDTLTGALDKLKAKADKPIPTKMFGDQDEHVRNFRMEVERLTMKYQPLAQATRSYEATVAELNTAHRVGIISSKELTLQLEKERLAFERLKTSASGAEQVVHAANGNGGKESQYRRQNLTYQAFDVGQTAAMGMSPAMILAQQGPQIAQLYAGAGGIKALAGDLVALGRVVAPAAIGVAAAYGAYKLLASYSAEAALAVRDSTRALAEQAAPMEDLEGKVADLAKVQKDYSDALLVTATSQDLATQSIVANSAREFEAKKSLLELELKRQEASMALQQSEMAIASLQLKKAVSTQVNTRLDLEAKGFSDPRVGRFVNNLPDDLTGLEKTREVLEGNPASDRIKELKANTTLLDVAIGKLRDGLKQTFNDGGDAGPTFAGDIPVPTKRPLIELEGLSDGKKERSQADRDENVYKRAIESSREQVEQMKLQAQTAGEAGVAADTFRFKLDLLQKAFKDGKEATADQRKDIDQLAESYRMAAQAAADARFASDIGFNARQSQRSGRDQQIASQLKGYGFGEDLNSPQADALRQQMQWKEAKDSATSFGQTFSSTLVSSSGDIGKSFAAALKGALEKETAKLWDRVFDGLGTMFANWLTGTPGAGGSTAGAGLGAVASALTGKVANDNTAYTAPVGAVTRSALASPAQVSSLMSFLPKGKDQGHITGMSGDLQSRLSSMLAEAPKGVASDISINSGFRSVARQKELFDAAVSKYGSVAAARKWVAPPGNSQHNFGRAADLGFGSDAARDWTHQNAGQYGLKFPMANEPWHIETATARGGAGLGGASSSVEAVNMLADSTKKAAGNVDVFGGGLGKMGSALSSFPAAPAAGASGGGGGMFSWLGGLFGAFKPNGAQATLAASGSITGMFANGTNSAPGGMSIVGERGPELLNLPQGSGVVSNHKLMEALSANQNGGGGGIAGVRVFMDDDMKLHAKVESIAERKAQQTSRQNLGSYKQNQQRSGVGSDQKAYNSRKG